MLELELDGNPISEYGYLENALKLIPGINLQGQGGRKLSRKWDQEPRHSALDVNLDLGLG